MSIEYEITEQNFEKIRTRVAEIIVLELAEQFTQTSNALFQAGVWLERFIPFDKGELPAIKVYFISSTYNSQIPQQSAGSCKIHIEITVKEKDSSVSSGDSAASIKCQKLTGVIRYILEHALYLRLGYLPNTFIYGTEITDIGTEVPNVQDGFHAITNNIILNVRYAEENGLQQPVTGEIYSSVIKIDETEKGYKIEKIIT